MAELEVTSFLGGLVTNEIFFSYYEDYHICLCSLTASATSTVFKCSSLTTVPCSFLLPFVIVQCFVPQVIDIKYPSPPSIFDPPFGLLTL